MKNTALVIMAAGIGNRFEGDIKQLRSVGPNGGIIVDYSIYDAMEAGFNKVIFIIRRDLEKDFEEIIEHRIEKLLPMEYAYQELEDLPADYEMTPGRARSWRIGQAVLSVKGMVDGPFLVINANDCYGRGGLHRIHNYMAEHMDSRSELYNVCTGGFVLSGTLGDDDTVTRGVCQVDEEGCLANVTETYNIQTKEDGLHAMSESDAPITISPSQPVSMNVQGLPASSAQELEEGFSIFLDNLKEDDIKSEYLLPKIIDSLVQSKKTRVTVLDTPGKWFGVTYREDKQVVAGAIRGPIQSGVYKEKLF